MWVPVVQVDLDDVVYLLGDLWGGRSASAAAGDREALTAEAARANSGRNLARKGTWRDLRPLCLVRRDPAVICVLHSPALRAQRFALRASCACSRVSTPSLPLLSPAALLLLRHLLHLLLL